MTRSEFYHKALLAVIQPVTQAYILKHGLPFAENPEDVHERMDERMNQLDSISEMADFLAMKLTGYWKDTDIYFNEEDQEDEEEESFSSDI